MAGRRRILFAFAFLATALVTIVLLGRPAGAGAEGSGELTVQPALGAPAGTMFGASSQEAPGEVWATGPNNAALARYSDAAGWETVSAGGNIRFASVAGAGRTTPRGGIVAAATNPSEINDQFLVVRDPGGVPGRVEGPGLLLEPGEELFGSEGTNPLLAAEEGSGGQTRAYVVPSARHWVLDYNGSGWSKEEVCVATTPAPGCTLPEPGFRILAIDASGGEAWLLARDALPGEGIELFRREPSGPGGIAVWRQQSLGPPGSTGALYAQAAPLDAHVAARALGQPLTVSAAGAWVDVVLTQGGQAIEGTIFYDRGAGRVTGSWCDYPHPSQLCQFPLGTELPAGQARSFAWASGGTYGQRTITGVGQGAIVNLEGSAFNRVPLAGGEAGAALGAALSAPDQGWLGAKPPLQLTRSPQPGGLQSWPVPFRRPLTAVAAQPGVPIGALGSEALAVGDNGQAARYIPGQGWIAEPLLNSAGKRATPTLRGVAWPESGRAYAVGDNAAMWLWRRETGLWQPDPAEPQNLARANFTGVAFDPARPSRGYAVGKQGLLLAYGREWKPEALPIGVPAEANFSSIAFAGREALATWKIPVLTKSGAFYQGGVIANDGSGWRVDDAANAALGGAIPQRVAGLPDGGAVIASLASGEGGAAGGVVIERPGPGGAWQGAAGGSPGYPVALAAIREAAQVRAVVSVAPVGVEAQGSKDLGTDQEQVFNQPPPGQPPLLTDPYPLPGTGLVTRQTAGGWRDEQRQAYPLPTRVAGQEAYDLAQRPDPVLALLISPDGSQGWAVGGETGTLVQFRGESLQTAGVQRYGATASSPANASVTPILASAGTATFAIGGGDECAGPCADMAGVGIGPDRWLKSSVGKAAAIPHVRAFLYTGPGVADPSGNERLSQTVGVPAFAREENAYAHRLSAAAGSLPIFAAAAESDLDSSGSLATFGSAFSAFDAPLGSSPPATGIGPVSQAGPGQHYYSFDSGGSEGPVRMIVLDYSLPALGEAQTCWLAGQIAGAGALGYPAIVIGERDLGRRAPNAAADAAQVVPILLGAAVPGCSTGGPAASAYFFDYPEQNRTYNLNSGGRSIPTFGSGTLGYVESPRQTEKDFVGASGFLLGSVNVSGRDPTTNIAPVTVRLIPNVGSLALDPTDGTLLRRSKQALFRGLARRPLAGTSCAGSTAPTSCEVARPEPYVPIPTECQGGRCATGIFPEYTFSSSEPDIADFVAHDPRSLNPRNVQLINNRPVLDPHSGLLCPFNEGTTIVTVSAGGLSYSQKVKVLGGTAQRPCGTTPLRNRTITTSPSPTAPPPANEPPPTFQSPPTIPPPPPPVVPAAAPAPAAHQPPAPPALPPTFFATPAQLTTPIVPIVPPPPPLVLQPTPPSGSSYVQEKEEEEEEAVEHSSLAVAERLPGRPASAQTLVSPPGGGGSGLPIYVLPALALVAALAGVSMRPRRPRRERRPEISYVLTDSPRRHR
jgi:hypothetical protein